MLSPKTIYLKTAPPQKLNFYFLMLSPKIIYLKTAPHPQKLNFYFLMLSPKIIYLKTAPHPQKLNFYFLMLSPKIIYLKTAPPPRNWTSTFWCWVQKSYTWIQPPPPIELLTWDADYRYKGSQRGDFYCLWRLIWPSGQCFIWQLISHLKFQPTLCF